MKDGQGPTPGGSERWFTFRPLRPHDKQELQALQEEWFPVRYENAFYDNAVLGLSSNGKKSLVSVAAVENTFITVTLTLTTNPILNNPNPDPNPNPNPILNPNP